MSWRVQGMRTWLWQRLTAVYMLLFGIGFSLFVVTQNIDNYQAWRSLFEMPAISIASALFFFSLLYHAWVGVRDILIDYIKWSTIRFVVWTLITVGLIALGIWVAMMLYSVVAI